MLIMCPFLSTASSIKKILHTPSQVAPSPTITRDGSGLLDLVVTIPQKQRDLMVVITKLYIGSGRDNPHTLRWPTTPTRPLGWHHLQGLPNLIVMIPPDQRDLVAVTTK